MGEYNLEESYGCIIIDDHVFERVSDGIYRATDLYYVDIEQWRDDKRNSDMLVIFQINDISDTSGIVEYITTGSWTELNKLMNRVRPKYEHDLLQTYCRCRKSRPTHWDDEPEFYTWKDVEEEVE